MNTQMLERFDGLRKVSSASCFYMWTRTPFPVIFILVAARCDCVQRLAFSSASRGQLTPHLPIVGRNHDVDVKFRTIRDDDRSLAEPRPGFRPRALHSTRMSVDLPANVLPYVPFCHRLKLRR